MASLLVAETIQGSENKQLPYQLIFGSNPSDQDPQDDESVDLRPRSLLPDMDGKTALIITPYPYSLISHEQRAKTTYVPESCYVVLPEGNPITQAVVGPVSPCICLAMQDVTTKKMIIIHKNRGNTDTALLKILQNEFLETPSDNLRLITFTCAMIDKPEDKQQAHRSAFETTNQKIRETFRDLKDDKVDKNFYTPSVNTQYNGKYCLSDAWVKITNDKVFSISPYNETILSPKITRPREILTVYLLEKEQLLRNLIT